MSKRWEQQDNFIAGTSFDGDNIVITHAQNIDPYLKAAQVERMGNFYDKNGFSGMGNMRKIGSIPDLIYTKLIKEDPELASNPEKLIQKLKEMKAKGLDFTTVEKI